MKKVVSLVALATVLFACKKEECASCHYDDASGNEVELGNKCGDDLKNLEQSGYTVNGVKYDAHCGEEH